MEIAARLDGAEPTNAIECAPAWNPDDDLRPVEIPADGEKKASVVVFVCRFPGCGKQFQLKGNLKRHQNIHRGDKQFKCSVCDREFLRKADMEVHQRVHTGEKPYLCKVAGCEKRFARRSDLLSHERTHSGKKPFACDFPGCDRRFARRFDLHKHQRMHEDMCASSGSVDADPAKKATMKRRLSAGTTSSESDLSASPTPEAPVRPRDFDRAEIDTSDTSVSSTAPQVRAPISPTDHADGPGKEFHFELTCTQDHIHSPPECFAGFSSIESWDALLGATPAGVPCCPEHLPVAATKAVTPAYTPPMSGAPAFNELVAAHTTLPERVHGRMSSAKHPHVHPPHLHHEHTHTHDAHQSQHSHQRNKQQHSTDTPCPVVATAKLHDYSAHTSCGHLAIQHGDHRDFVVKNHLVCLDSVKSLSGDCGPGACPKPKAAMVGGHSTIGEHGNATTTPSFSRGVRCAPQDTHRPGCGHLAVRHRDHIDYVVEDNLFCQYAGMLEDADNIELLDDDFWEFYGAVGSLNTD